MASPLFTITDRSDVTPRGPLGLPGEDSHARFCSDAVERAEHYREKMGDAFRRSLDYWDLYLNYRRDFRQPGEEWRANIGVPEPFSAIETSVASVVSILTSADPLIQPEAVHDDFMDSARSIERLLDHTFRANRTTKLLTKLLRSRDVQGTCFFKVLWEERAHTINVSYSEAELLRYTEYLQKTLADTPGLPMPPLWLEDPAGFERWRQMVNLSKRARIPAPPLSGERRLIQYRGPVFYELPMYNVSLDPMVDEMTNQNFVAHRAVKSRAWLEKMVREGVYDEAAVTYALSGWDGRVMASEEEEIASKLGIASGGADDPQYRNSVGLLEVWQPGTEVPYAVILNEKAVINRDPYHLPTWDGECGIIALRSLVIPGHFHGMSKLAQSKSLFEELNKLRNLRLDGATLNTLPVFTKLREVGIPDMLLKMQPAAIIPVSRPDALQSLRREPMPPEAWREPAEIKQEIADATGFYASTKGAPAQIGRVTGTEYQGRSNQAQLRIKLDAMFTEEDFVPVTRKVLMLWAQMGEDQLRVRVGGQPDPFVTLSREELLESLEIDWRFRGATKAINKDLQVQQLLTFADKFGPLLKPAESRYLARLVLDTLDVRGSGQIVSEAGTGDAVQDYTSQRQLQQLQIQQQVQALMAPPPPPGAPPVQAGAPSTPQGQPPAGGQPPSPPQGQPPPQKGQS